MNSRFLARISSFLILLLISACSSPPTDRKPSPDQAQGPVYGGSLLLAQTTEPTMLNPILYQDTASGFVNSLVFDSLLRLDSTFTWQPMLAEALPTVEQNGLKWTFRLRSGILFHDGEPLTSRDVRFTFAAIQHPGYTGVRASNYVSLKGVTALRATYASLDRQVTSKKMTQAEAERLKLEAWEKWSRESGAITTPDDRTVIFTLDRAFAPMLSAVAGMGILPSHELREDLGSRMKDAPFNRAPIGSGRYAFVEWRPQERIVLKANESWWGGRPYIDQLVWQVFPNNRTAMSALMRAEVHGSAIEPDQLERFRTEVPYVTVYEFPTTNYSQVSLDLRNELFRDVRVRQAMAHALNKEAMVEKLLGGHGLPAWSHGTPSRWDFNPHVPTYPYDPRKADELLQSAGWVRGFDGIRVKDGKKFAFELYFNSGEKLDADAAQMAHAAWKAIGLDVSLRGVDFPTLLEITNAANPERQQPPAYILGWSLGAEPDSYSIWGCEGSFNDIGYCNPRVDQLLRMGRDETRVEKRKVIYAEIQQLLAEDQPYIWLYFPNTIQGLSSRVRGPVAGTPAGMFWNIEQWWLEQ